MVTLADKINAAKPNDAVYWVPWNTKFAWEQKDTSLWLVRDGETIFCERATIKSLEMDMPSLLWLCPNHHRERENFCGKCGVPRSDAACVYYGGKICVVVMMPSSTVLCDLVKGDVLEIRHRECGRADVYENGDLVLKFIVKGVDVCTMTNLAHPILDKVVNAQAGYWGRVERWNGRWEDA